MAWTCTLYTNFKKRVNSTKRPDGGTSYPCRIKNNTDFKNPSFEIYAGDLSDVSYMYFNGQYFYVTNVVSHRTGVWEVSARRDPMATFKYDITRTISLVMYAQSGNDMSASGYRIPDERIPVRKNPSISRVNAAFDAFYPSTIGTYVLSAVGENNGVVNYMLSRSAMEALIQRLNYNVADQVDTWFGISSTPSSVMEAITYLRNGFSYGVSQALSYGNYTSCIKSCYWIPFRGLSGSSRRIYLGDYDTGVNGEVFSYNMYEQAVSIDIPWYFDDWRRNNHILKLYLPFCGVVVIPTDKALTQNTVLVQISLDSVGGTLAYKVSCGTYIQACGANIAAPYAIGSSNVSLNNFMSGAMSAIGGGISGAIGAAAGGIGGLGSAVGGISSVASGIGQAITPAVQSVGNMGGIASAAIAGNISLEVLYYPPVNYNNFLNNFGYPVCNTTTPKDGFNLCKGFSVECAGTPEEISEINSYFNTGAYVE